MQFTIKLEGVEKVMQMFDPHKVARAASAALNRAVKSGKTEASSLIRKRWNIKKFDLDRKIEFKGALMSDLKAIITVRGEPINLLYFQARQIVQGKSIKLQRERGKGILEGKFKIGRGRGYSGVTAQIEHTHKTVLPHAFMAKGKGGTPLVFIRSSKAKSTSGRKEGLVAIKVITEASIFKQGRVLDNVIKKIKTQWQKEWDNQIKQLQSGIGWMEQ